MRRLIVFEDAALRAFDTLTHLRGVFDLRCGARTLLERLREKCAAGEVLLLARPELHTLLRETHSDAAVGAPAQEPASRAGNEREAVFLNGRLLALGSDVQRLLDAPAPAFVVLDGDVLVAARCAGDAGARLAAFLQSALQTDTSRAIVGGGGLASWLQSELPDVRVRRLADEPEILRHGSRLLAHAWEIVQNNGAAVTDDSSHHATPGIAPSARIDPGVQMLETSAIHLGEGVRLAPGTVLDAEGGPIIIEKGVLVRANSYICGPTSIGAGSVINAGSRILAETSLGPVCKVGGEVAESVLQGFANKQHDGFLGHAFLGEWVNLGADTNNSDLKNNYSSVRVWEDGRFVDSGSLFVGLIAGDHVKSAINTQFNTGTVVGISSQIFGPGFPPKYVPGFSWGGADGLETYDYDKALHTARVVMERRQQPLSAAYAAAFRLAFERSRTRNPE